MLRSRLRAHTRRANHKTGTKRARCRERRRETPRVRAHAPGRASGCRRTKLGGALQPVPNGRRARARQKGARPV
eukprot:4515063-Pleurochrysis_carterae.AAC.1